MPTFSANIIAAPLTIMANNGSKTYGQTMTYSTGSTAFTSSGLENGETIGTVTLTASGGAAATATVGSYTLTPSAATGGTFNAGNYSSPTTPALLSVTPAPLTVMAKTRARSTARRPRAYGQLHRVRQRRHGEPCLAAAPASRPWPRPPARWAANDHRRRRDALAANYSFNPVNGTLSVTPAPLTVTANNQMKVYGSANPSLTASYTGFVNGATRRACSAATPASRPGHGRQRRVGRYTITATVGSSRLANYSFNPVNGTLLVTPAR